MNVVAVVVPDTFTFCRKVAFVFVLIFSVAAIPVKFAPVIAGNVEKLKKRYPGGEFDVYKSENRLEGDL